MSWLGNDQNSDSAQRDERYLRIPDPREVDTTYKAIIRFVDESPKAVWRHWVNNRPYNCPGFYQGCPICKARKAEQNVNPKGYKDKFRMDRKWLANVLLLGFVDEDGNTTYLTEPEVKIFSFGKELGETLEEFYKDKEWGDLRDYDVYVIKRKTGNQKWDVRYKAMTAKKYDLAPSQVAIAENKHDIVAEVAPSTIEALNAALSGRVDSGSVRSGTEDGNSGTETSDIKGASNYAPLTDVLDLKVKAEDKGYDLRDFFPGKAETEYDLMEFEKVKTTLARL